MRGKRQGHVSLRGSSAPGAAQIASALRSPIRIAVLFDNFGPYHIARLAAARRQCDVLGIEGSRRSREYAWSPTNGETVFPRETLVDEGTTDEITGKALAARLNDVLTAFVPSVVAIPGWSSRLACLALRWCYRQIVPAVLMSESQLIDEPRKPLKEWVKRRKLRFFGSALVGGQSHREYAIHLGMPSDRVCLGYDAVDNEYFASHAARARSNATEIRDELGLPSQYFLASNRFVPKKNLPVLIRAFGRYRKASHGPAWGLVILGDGPLRPDIESLIHSLGLNSSVHLPGFVQYDKLPKYYGLAGAFIHASTTEQWGLVVNEAMASGLPVIVSDRCGCAKDLVGHGINGFRFAPTDEATLAQLMTQIADDVELRAAMGPASSERIRNWGLDRFARGLQQAAQCALNAGSRRQQWLDEFLLHLQAVRRTT